MMLKHPSSVLAFMVVTFSVQGASHFVINKAHYDAIGFARAEPIMALGFLVMIIQGLILTFALAAWRPRQVAIIDGLVISLAFGLVLVSYVALAEPAKYAAPSVQSWFIIEALAGIVQWGVFGLVLGLIHKRFGASD